MKHKLMTVLALCALALGLSSCGKKVAVPPSYVGKIVTKTGLQEDLKHPSTFRLPIQWSGKSYLVLASVADEAFEEEIKLFMPKDKLNLVFDVRGITSVSSSPSNIDPVFNKLPAVETSEFGPRTKVVSADKIYDTYARQVIRSVTRAVVAKYTIEEVLTNRGALEQEIYDEVAKGVAKSAITIKRIGLADIQPPDVIVKAQETAKEREVAIQQAEAEKQVSLAEAEAKFEVAKKQQEIDLLEAETQVLVEKKLADAVSDAYVVQRSLRSLEALVSNPQSKVFLIPTEAMSDPSLMIGLNQEALKSLNKATTASTQ